MSPVIAIIGSREYKDLEWLGTQIRRLKGTTNKVISGAARGIDREAAKLAAAAGIEVEEFPADWNGPLKKGAGFARNQIMAEKCTGCWAFWDGESKGTLDMVKRVRALGKPVVLWGPNRERRNPDEPHAELVREVYKLVGADPRGRWY